MSPWVLVALLVFALVVCLFRMREQTRIARGLVESMQRGHSFLRENRSGWNKYRSWRALMDVMNELVEERNHLDTERARQVERMHATITNMQEAVLIIDDDDQILVANQSLHRLFPLRKGRAGVERVLESGTLMEHLRVVRESGFVGRREIEFGSEDPVVWVEVSGSRISGFGGNTGEATLLILHDITRLRRLESVRKEFVANVSHELRTPLSLIKGYVETLNDGGPSVPEADRERFLKIIMKHTSRLERLVEDLLALSRLESGNPRLRKEELLVETVIEEIIETYRSGERGSAPCSFIFKPAEHPEPVLADPLRIAQVLGNLFENAIKYSEGDVTVEAGTCRDGDFMRVWVSDNGVGIARKDLPHIFERFYRVDKGRSRESGGTGLGLSIVKHIVQLHSGQVWAESGLGQGTRIIFTLPVRKPEEQSGDTEAAVAGAGN